MLAQGVPARLNRMRRTLMHCNDLVFRPNNGLDVDRRKPLSIKKNSKGDAAWSTHKTILGWTVDSLWMTIKLPPHRRDRLHTLIAETQQKRTLSVTTCQKLLGELRSIALGIPGARRLFSHLQWALVHVRHHNVVCLNHNARDALSDFAALTTDILSCPTRIAEIIPTAPSFIGACDTAPVGMGGIWLPPPNLAHQQPPIL
ncbi:hypothetical protein ACA910_016635 [Epithemia clementina (nom. ined.)]